MRGRLSGADAGLRVRVLAERLGGLWVKLAQLASLRIDIFGLPFCAELARLQDTGTGFSSDAAVAIVEAELGAPLDDLFDSFERAPVAAASIGQVHRARLRGGGPEVAVKVQRPGIAATVERQLAALERVAGIASRMGVLPQLAWRQFAWELREVMREELDYRYEAANTARMRRTLKAHDIVAPRVYARLSTARVLTTRFVHGVAMADYIRMVAADPVRANEWLRSHRIDPARVAERLAISLLRQILEDNLFHGDLHPGNILLLEDGAVALIDYGTVSTTDLEYLEKFRALTAALAAWNFRSVAEIILLMSDRLPVIDTQTVIDDLVRAIHAWAGRTFVPDLRFHDKSLNNVYGEVTRVLIRYGIRLQWSFLRIRRAQETLDASLMVLHPEANATEVAADYFRQAGGRDVARLATAGVTRRLLAGAAIGDRGFDDAADAMLLQLEGIRRKAYVFAIHSGRLATLATATAAWLATGGGVAAGAIAAGWLIPDLDVVGVASGTIRLVLVAGSAGFTLSCFRLWRRLRRPELFPAGAR